MNHITQGQVGRLFQAHTVEPPKRTLPWADNLSTTDTGCGTNCNCHTTSV